MDSERDNPFTPPPMNFAIEDLAFHPRLNLSQEGREASNGPELESESSEEEEGEEEESVGAPGYQIGEEGIDRLVEKFRRCFGKEGTIMNCDGDIGRVIAQTVWDEKDRRDHKEQRITELKMKFVEEDGYKVCVPCRQHAIPALIPKHLRKRHKGNFAVLIRSSAKNHSVLRSMNRNERNPLHKWCCEQWELSQAQEKNDKQDSIEAARNMIINVLLVLKDPEKSSNDFVKMCNADELKGLKVPTVNDGRQQFFALRDDIYEKYKAIMCFIFESVNVIGVTLDKVTLNKKSYTVIVTYYINEDGKMKTVLNDVFPMRSTDGSGEATAK